jgi:hypothetical protein
MGASLIFGHAAGPAISSPRVRSPWGRRCPSRGAP